MIARATFAVALMGYVALAVLAHAQQWFFFDPPITHPASAERRSAVFGLLVPWQLALDAEQGLTRMTTEKPGQLAAIPVSSPNRVLKPWLVTADRGISVLQRRLQGGEEWLTVAEWAGGGGRAEASDFDRHRDTLGVTNSESDRPRAVVHDKLCLRQRPKCVRTTYAEIPNQANPAGR